MRCARCDRIAVPQVLARLPDGRLVFGWCRRCVQEERGVVLQVGRVGGHRWMGVGPKRRSRLLLRDEGRLAWGHAARVPRQRTMLRAIRHGIAVSSLLLLVVGIVRHDPRRDPVLVVVTSLAVAVSVFVGWVEHRLDETPTRRPTGVL